MTRICDYEGSKYRTEFWESQNRAYEDAVERVALQKLLPSHGERLIEIGAGFGRLVDLYQGYKQIILTDYARTQLEEAQRYLGHNQRIIYVVANVYEMPFVDHLFDTVSMIRVMHHLTDAPAALKEIYRIIAPDGVAVIEYASKLHLKSILRWLLHRQRGNPFDPEPLEFVELNFNFHPTWMRQQFEAVGLHVKNIRSLSHYRIGWLKRLFPTSFLVKLDSWAQPTGNWWQLAPSIFLQAQAQKPSAVAVGAAAGLFRCPACHAAAFSQTSHSSMPGAILLCQSCRKGWSFRDGIYDFKTPIDTF